MEERPYELYINRIAFFCILSNLFILCIDLTLSKNVYAVASSGSLCIIATTKPSLLSDNEGCKQSIYNKFPYHDVYSSAGHPYSQKEIALNFSSVPPL